MKKVYFLALTFFYHEKFSAMVMKKNLVIAGHAFCILLLLFFLSKLALRIDIDKSPSVTINNKMT